VVHDVGALGLLGITGPSGEICPALLEPSIVPA